jgi:hypothetical protein
VLHWLWTCFRQPVEPRCNPRVPCVTSLYTGGSSTSPSHPPPFDARPSPNRRGRRKDGPLCHRASHRLLTTDALATPRRTSIVLCGASPVPSPNFRESWRRVGFATDAHGVGVGVGAGSTSTARSRRSRWSVRLCGLAGDDRLPLPAAGLCCSPGGVRPSWDTRRSLKPSEPVPSETEYRTRQPLRVRSKVSLYVPPCSNPWHAHMRTAPQ